MILELLTNSLWVYLLLVFVAIGTLYSLTKAGPIRKYDTNLLGKVVIITGASAGVGKATALKLAQRNATLVFACRNQEKTSQIIEQIRNETRNGNLHFIKLELSDYDSIRQFVKTFQSQFVSCDMLINNAGIFKIDKQFNKRGHELTYATNHLGHFLLTNLMLPYMSKQSRIINVASGAHTFLRNIPDFEKAQSGQLGVGMSQYSTTKFCNILFTQALAEKFENQPMKFVSLHPGFVRSEIYTEKNGANKYLSYIARIVIDIFMRQFSLTEEEGARTTEYCALQEYENLVNGGYYEKNKLSKASNMVRKCGKEQELWTLSAKAVDLQ